MSRLVQMVSGSVGAEMNGTESMWQAALQLLGALALIVPLLYIVTRLYARRAWVAGSRRALTVIDSVGLGPNRAVCLVEVGNRLLVVGSAPERVGLLTEITDPDEIALVKEKAQGPSGAGLVESWRARFWGASDPGAGDKAP